MKTLPTMLIAGLILLAAPQTATARDYRIGAQKPNNDGAEVIRIDVNGEQPGVADVRVRIDQPPYDRDNNGEEKPPGKDPGAEEGRPQDYDKQYRLDNAIDKAAAIVECINAQKDTVEARQGKDANGNPTAEVFITGKEGEVVLGVYWQSGTGETHDVIEVAHQAVEPEPDPYDDPMFWLWLWWFGEDAWNPFEPFDPFDFYMAGSVNSLDIDGFFTGHTQEGEAAILNVGSCAVPTEAFASTEDALLWVQSSMWDLGHVTIRGPGNTLVYFTMDESVALGTNDAGALATIGIASPQSDPPAWFVDGAMDGTLAVYDGAPSTMPMWCDSGPCCQDMWDM